MNRLLLVLITLFLLNGCNIRTVSQSEYEMYSNVNVKDTENGARSSNIQFGDDAIKALNKEDLKENSFDELSNDLHILFSCGIVPYSRIDYIEDIELYTQQEKDKYKYYKLLCSFKNDSFSICCIRSIESNQIILDSVIRQGKNEKCYYMRGRTLRDYIRINPEDTRQTSILLLMDKCCITQEKAFQIMKEIDLLFDVQTVDFYDIKAIQEVAHDEETVKLTVTSLFDKEYTIVIGENEDTHVLEIIKDSLSLYLRTQD